MTAPPPQRGRDPRLPYILVGAAVLILLVIAAIVFWPEQPPTSTTSTTETTLFGTTTTDDVTTTTTTIPGPTTPTSGFPPTTIGIPPPQAFDYDIVVVGDGLGGLGVAVTAARLGANVALLSEYAYLGGQAGSAGVSTMDEGSNHSVLRRSGMYGELAAFVQAIYPAGETGDCYFVDDSLCPEPYFVDQFFRGALSDAGVDVHNIAELDGVLQVGNKVTGVLADGSTYNAAVVVDATEFSDLYPLVSGLAYELGSETGCVQDTTWLAIRSWYPSNPPEDLVPPREAAQQLFDVYGTEFDSWLESFRGSVLDVPDRGTTGPGITPWDVATETQYRALADRRDYSTTDGVPSITRTGVNYANDYALSLAAIEIPATRISEFTAAIDKTYAYLWYLRWELGVTDWGIDTTQGYSAGQRMLWSPQIPDAIEVHMPLAPYVREGRRLAGVELLTSADLSNDVRGFHRFDNSVMLGGYFSDFHGCTEPESGAGFGLFEVPMGVFIPATIDGFMPGMARSASVARSAAAAVRTQPEEIWSGQAVGIIAALAVRNGIEVREVSPAAVQELLLANGLIYFLPG